MTKMDQNEVGSFVADLLAAGLTVVAFGRDVYLIYDNKLPRARRFDIGDRLDQISARYGDRRHLSTEIVRYLRSMGHIYPPTDDSVQ
jgi:hypothetical protein